MPETNAPTSIDFAISLLPLLLIVVFAYFVVIRPVRARMRQNNINLVQAAPAWVFLAVGVIFLFLAVPGFEVASENELAALVSEEARGKRAVGQVFGMAFAAIGIALIAAVIFKGFFSKGGSEKR